MKLAALQCPILDHLKRILEQLEVYKMINRHSSNQQVVRGHLSEVRLPFADLQLIIARECSQRHEQK